MSANSLFPQLVGRVLSRRINQLGNGFDSVFDSDTTDSVIITGDSTEVMARMPDGVFQACITSPPYWSLRNYNIAGQIGLESSLEKYLEKLVLVFEQVRRVLRDREEFGGGLQNRVAIEIKGGTDKSNAHNRAGEAEKSHQKARSEDFRDFWTIIAKKGLDIRKLQAESPTTNSWFDVAQVLGRNGEDWDEFRTRLAGAVGISLASPRRRGSR